VRREVCRAGLENRYRVTEQCGCLLWGSGYVLDRRPGMTSGFPRQLATVRTDTVRCSANDSLDMRKACRSKSARPPDHVAITCMRGYRRSSPRTWS
jgi:hypothetical protein